MEQPPFYRSLLLRFVGVAAVVVVAAVLAGLLKRYGNLDWAVALGTGCVYTLLLAVAGYAYWYVSSFLRAFQAHLLLALLVQLACTGITCALLLLLRMADPDTLLFLLPLFPVCGLPAWVILGQWYAVYRQSSGKLPDPVNDHPPVEPEPEEAVEKIDRISVKEGTEIHIIRLDELLYIQAYGDYVFLYTDREKYLKEQTMKYFEQHLPDSFVRIHRSTIVNTSQILRMELFGKETWQIRLKNDSSLKASASGYKLLKQRLSL